MRLSFKKLTSLLLAISLVLHIVNVRLAEIIEIAEDIGIIDKAEAYNGKNLSYRVTQLGQSNPMTTVNEPNMAGSTGQGIALQQLRIDVVGLVGNENIDFRCYSNGTWQPWTNRGNLIGVAGQPLTAIQVRLVNMDGWSIYTRVHVSNIGWMDWVRNGETAGVVGNPGSFRIEAVEIFLLKENHAPPPPANKSALRYDFAHSVTTQHNHTVDLHLLKDEEVFLKYFSLALQTLILISES